MMELVQKVNLNDMWVLDYSDNKWMWVNGNNTKSNFGVYGTKGVSAPTNTPGARYHLTHTDWIDNSGNIYLFGGLGYSTSSVPGNSSYMNDMWKFKVEGACNYTLPIELLSFTGVNYNGKNDLSWITASEVNNDYFMLERSVDGISFDEFKKITGSGNTSVKSNYQCTDDEPFDLTYYRLKNVDYDGTYYHSKIIALKNNSVKNGGELIVYPTPSSGEKICIKLKGFHSEQKVLLNIVDVFGQTVFSKILLTNPGGSILEAIDVSKKFSSGVYTVIGAVRDEVYKQRLIIK